MTEQMKGAYVTEKRLRQFGKTKGCPKCENGTGIHSEACVRGFRELVYGTETQEESAPASFSTASGGSSSSSGIGPAPGLQTKEQEGRAMQYTKKRDDVARRTRKER